MGMVSPADRMRENLISGRMGELETERPHGRVRRTAESYRKPIVPRLSFPRFSGRVG